MADGKPVIRPARREDAAALAELVNMAGEGMPLYLWGAMAERDEDPWSVGRRRAERDTGGFSWRNASILENGGQVIGALIGYPLPDAPEPIPEDMPKMFVPLQELENLACGTWYVNVVAVFPAARGRGHGSRLLHFAEELARDAGSGGLSIIVADSNAGARRLYERHGYREIASRPTVKNGWRTPTQNWLLLVKGRAMAS